MKVTTTIKAGGLRSNHNTGMRVRSSVKAGGLRSNHNAVVTTRRQGRES
jgi:hypothetical protein